MGKIHDLVGLVAGVCVALLRPPAERERGDVPGWVMVTVMSAGIVGALAVIAEPQMSAMLRNALASVG